MTRRNSFFPPGVVRHLKLVFEKIGVETPNASGDTEKVPEQRNYYSKCFKSLGNCRKNIFPNVLTPTMINCWNTLDEKEESPVEKNVERKRIIGLSSRHILRMSITERFNDRLNLQWRDSRSLFSLMF